MATPTEGDEQPPDFQPKAAGGVDFQTAQRRVFEEAGVDIQSRFVALENPRVRIHIIEAGNPDSDESPIVFSHGTGGFGAVFAPLMAQLDDRRLITFDRPGHGLSGEFVFTANNLRQTASDVLEGVLDELKIDRADVVGSSGGGYWGIVFALTHPNRVRRLILVGGVPTFPGTSPPTPLRLLTVPGVSRLLARFQDPGEDAIIKQMEMAGEGETIQNYPALIQAMVAHDRFARTADGRLSELKALFTVFGWRGRSRLREKELQKLEPPAVFIWGEYDFLGGPDDVRDSVDSIPDAQLVAMDAGHGPWLGHPTECAGLIRGVKN